MIPKINHAREAEGLDKLTTAYRNKPVVRALLAAFLKESQELEYAEWSVIHGRLLGETQTLTPAEDADFDVDLTSAEETLVILDAEGVQLDVLAALVGEGPRAGRVDEDFLVGIKTRILVNRSDGLANDLIQIAARAVPTGVTTEYVEHGPAALYLTVSDYTYVTALANALRAARGGGVGGQILYSQESDANRFLWGSTTDAGIGTDLASATGGTTDPSHMTSTLGF